MRNFKKAIKKAIKKLLMFFDLEMRFLNVETSPILQTLAAINMVQGDLVFDIGANTGQFASELRKAGFSGEIISFEPLSEAINVLRKMSIKDFKWKVHDQCAIGDFDGEVQINISGNSVSSSILPMLNNHSLAAPQSSYVGNESVKIFKLDSIVNKYIKASSNIFIKIDTQGFEWQVLNGAENTLKMARGVLCELSLVQLYEGQHLWRQIIDRLEEEGFTLWAFQQGFTNASTGRSSQIDAIFLRL